ncbi:MAG: preprotein translocase subunit SecG [Chloroflexi bacterium]|nr:preprotein translocase subunit SecG [Chloroflexota bacterium]
MAFINLAQLIVSIVLVLLILVQVREGGSGLFGAAQNTLRTRRGMERTLFQFTIVLIAIFLLISIFSVRFA